MFWKIFLFIFILDQDFLLESEKKQPEPDNITPKSNQIIIFFSTYNTFLTKNIFIIENILLFLFLFKFYTLFDNAIKTLVYL